MTIEATILADYGIPWVGPRPVVVPIAEVVREPVTWCWLHRLPYGKVSIIEGDPGLGKSTLALDLAARLTTGEPMPGTTVEHEPAGVVILSAEDGLGDTIRPRLEAAGANLERVAALTGVLDGGDERMPLVPGDVAHVEQAVQDTRARLVILDPLMAYLAGEVNAHRDQDVRRALAPLASMAERTGAAVVVIRHLNKSAGASALYRGGGSIGITGAARAVVLVAPDPEDPEGGRRIVAMSKSNLAPLPPALAYRLVSDAALGCARIEWEGPTEHRAAELLAMPQTEDERSARGEAVAFLRDLLEAGATPAAEVRRMARQEGIADRTLDRAKRDAHVVSEREGFGPGSTVRWRLDAIGRHTSPAAHMYGSGALSASYGTDGVAGEPESAAPIIPDGQTGPANGVAPCPACGVPLVALPDGRSVCTSPTHPRATVARAPYATIACSDYRAHQAADAHVRDASGGWRCLSCEAPA
jgi:hypothetical protein